ncbi:Indoleamine 2,3-dioxygenase [Coniochaeta sp. 2T2.1]|nr:Indoleamine 2,3-dioxygenase [Coniochaeta sp. 2T2.1]
MIVIQPSRKHSPSASHRKATHRHHSDMDVTDISTRYHLDRQYGFVPQPVPLQRLPVAWERWETTLDEAAAGKLTHAEHILQLDGVQKVAELEKSRLWRDAVENMPILPIDDLIGHEMELRRAHQVLGFIAQFYAHTLSLTSPISIPRSVTLPLLKVSKELQIAPFITYWDHALDNWTLIDNTQPLSSNNIVSQTLFTGTADENELYMIDIRLELEGAVALEQLRLVAEQVTTSSEPDEALIAARLHRAATAIDSATQALKTTHKLVSPHAFYHTIAPWLRGPNLDPAHRVWEWEGADEVSGSEEMLRWVGSPNAGQSPLFPAIDASLGIAEDDKKKAFLDRVLPYMLRGHREYIQHLRSNGCPVRAYVEGRKRREKCGEASAASEAVAAYNEAVEAVKRFRTAHLSIVSQYILIPARKAEGLKRNHGYEAATPRNSPAPAAEGEGTEGKQSIGEVMGGLMGFLKGFRDATEGVTVD